MSFCAQYVREEFAELRLEAQWAIALPMQLRLPEWLASMKRIIDRCGAHLRVMEMRMQAEIDEIVTDGFLSHLAIKFVIP